MAIKFANAGQVDAAVRQFEREQRVMAAARRRAFKSSVNPLQRFVVIGGMALAALGTMAPKASADIVPFAPGAGGPPVTGVVFTPPPAILPAGPAVELPPGVTGGSTGALEGANSVVVRDGAQEICTGSCDTVVTGDGPEPEVDMLGVALAAGTFALAQVDYQNPGDVNLGSDREGPEGASVADVTSSLTLGERVDVTAAPTNICLAAPSASGAMINIQLGVSNADRYFGAAVGGTLAVVSKPPNWATAVDGILGAYTGFHAGDSTRKVIYLAVGDQYVEYTYYDSPEDVPGYVAGQPLDLPANAAVRIETSRGPAIIARNTQMGRLVPTAQVYASDAVVAEIQRAGGVLLRDRDGDTVGCNQWVGSVRLTNRATALDGDGIGRLDGAQSVNALSFGAPGDIRLWSPWGAWGPKFGESRDYMVRSVTIDLPGNANAVIDACNACDVARGVDVTMTHDARVVRLHINLEYRDGEIYQTGYRLRDEAGAPTGDVLTMADLVSRGLITQHQLDVIDEAIDSRIELMEAVQDTLAAVDAADFSTLGRIVRVDGATGPTWEFRNDGTNNDGVAALNQTVTGSDGTVYHVGFSYMDGARHVRTNEAAPQILLYKDGVADPIVYTRQADGHYTTATGQPLEPCIIADIAGTQTAEVVAAPSPPPPPPLAAAPEAPVTLASFVPVDSPADADTLADDCLFKATLSNGTIIYVRADQVQDGVNTNYNLTFSNTIDGTFGNQITVTGEPGHSELDAIGTALGLKGNARQIAAGTMLMGANTDGNTGIATYFAAKDCGPDVACAAAAIGHDALDTIDANNDGAVKFGADGALVDAVRDEEGAFVVPGLAAVEARGEPGYGPTVGTTGGEGGGDIVDALTPALDVADHAAHNIDAAAERVVGDNPAAKAGLEALFGLALAGMGLLAGRGRKKGALRRQLKVTAGDKGSKLADAGRAATFLAMPAMFGTGGGLLGAAAVTMIGLTGPIGAAVVGGTALVGGALGLMNAFGSNYNNSVEKKYRLSGFPAGTGKTAAQEVAQIRRDVLGSLAETDLPEDKTAAELCEAGVISPLQYAVLRWKENHPEAYAALIAKKPDDKGDPAPAPAPTRGADAPVPVAPDKGKTTEPVDLVAQIGDLKDKDEAAKALAIAMLRNDESAASEALVKVRDATNTHGMSGTDAELELKAARAHAFGGALQILAPIGWKYGKKGSFGRFKQGRLRDLAKAGTADAAIAYESSNDLQAELEAVLGRVRNNPKVKPLIDAPEAA